MPAWWPGTQGHRRLADSSPLGLCPASYVSPRSPRLIPPLLPLRTFQDLGKLRRLRRISSASQGISKTALSAGSWHLRRLHRVSFDSASFALKVRTARKVCGLRDSFGIGQGFQFVCCNSDFSTARVLSAHARFVRLGGGASCGNLSVSVKYLFGHLGSGGKSVQKSASTRYHPQKRVVHCCMCSRDLLLGPRVRGTRPSSHQRVSRR